jgi:hypothetical protein
MFLVEICFRCDLTLLLGSLTTVVGGKSLLTLLFPLCRVFHLLCIEGSLTFAFLGDPLRVLAILFVEAVVASIPSLLLLLLPFLLG